MLNIITPLEPASLADMESLDEALCWDCGGTGISEGETCAKCRGRGYVSEEEQVEDEEQE